MTTLTKEIELSREWKNISAILGVGTFSGDIVGVGAGGVVFQAVTDDNTPPEDDITGHPWRQTATGEPSPSRRVNLVAERMLWMRVSNGTCLLVISPV